jgi:hypothetical protein
MPSSAFAKGWRDARSRLARLWPTIGRPSLGTAAGDADRSADATASSARSWASQPGARGASGGVGVGRSLHPAPVPAQSGVSNHRGDETSAPSVVTVARAASTSSR